MPDGDPVLVQEEHTGEYGLRYSDDGVIETYEGDERVLVDADHPGETWHEADQAELQTSIERDLEDVREAIDELRAEELTDEQAQLLDHLEEQVETQENHLKFAKEVSDA